MIHKSIRTLPMVLYIEINETGDITLLSDEETPVQQLIEIWSDIIEADKNKSNPTEVNKIFNIRKEIDYQGHRFGVIRQACEALSFAKDQRLIDMLANYGYVVRDDRYQEDLQKVVRESNGIKNRIVQLENALPKKPENKSTEAFSIIDNMASISSILGFDFDFYTVSVEKYRSMESQVKIKIDNAKKQQVKSKK